MDPNEPEPATPQHRMVPLVNISTPDTPRKSIFQADQADDIREDATLIKSIGCKAKAQCDKADEKVKEANTKASELMKECEELKIMSNQSKAKAERSKLEFEEARKVYEEAIANAEKIADQTSKQNRDAALALYNKAEEESKKANDDSKVCDVAERSAFKLRSKALKAVADAAEKHRIGLEAWEIWKKIEAEIDCTSSMPKDAAATRKYSEFVSYAEDKTNNYPIMTWRLSQEQLNHLQKRYIIARQLGRGAMMEEIEAILKPNLDSIRSKEGFSFSVPKREADTLEYCDCLGMPLLLRGYTFERSFTNARTERRACLTAWVLTELYNAVSNEKFETLRSLFYKGKLWFRNPKEAADIVTDICCMLSCTTSSLNIVAEDTGAVAGSVKLKIAGRTKDLYCVKGKKFLARLVR